MDGTEKHDSGSFAFGSNVGVRLIGVGGLVLYFALFAILWYLEVRLVRLNAPIMSILGVFAAIGFIVMIIGLVALSKAASRHDRPRFSREEETPAPRMTVRRSVQLAAGIFGLLALGLPWFFATSAGPGGYYAEAVLTPTSWWGLPALGSDCQPGSGCYEQGRQDWATARLIALAGVGIYVLGCVLVIIQSIARFASLRYPEIPMYVGLFVVLLGIAYFGTRTYPLISGGSYYLGLGPSYGLLLALGLSILVSLGRWLEAPRTQAPM